MIEILRDEQGNLKAVCEYYVVDKDGHMKDDGEYVWVNEMEVAPQYRNNGCLRKFVSKIVTMYPQAKYGYFSREKYNKRVRMYSKRQWLNIK